MVALLIFAVCLLVYWFKTMINCQTIGNVNDKTNPYRDISVDEFNAHLRDGTLHELPLAPSREVKK